MQGCIQSPSPLKKKKQQLTTEVTELYGLCRAIQGMRTLACFQAGLSLCPGPEQGYLRPVQSSCMVEGVQLFPLTAQVPGPFLFLLLKNVKETKLLLSALCTQQDLCSFRIYCLAQEIQIFPVFTCPKIDEALGK